MLLMSLDSATAADLLRGVDPRIVEELAVELSYMEAAGLHNPQQAGAVAQEFFSSLGEGPNQGGSEVQTFLEEMLKGTVGQERAKQFQSGLGELLRKRDPFLPIRKAGLDTLVAVLEKEHPQAVAVILAELSPRRSSALLGRLSDGVRISAVSRMTGVGAMSPEAKLRIAEMVAAKIEQVLTAKTVGMVEQGTVAVPVAGVQTTETGTSPLRKVAVVVRTLERELRDNILAEIRRKDKAAVEAIEGQMILWEDLSLIGDRSMQEGLRGLDERTLAIALFEADEAVTRRIKSNISERAATMIAEETSLMQKPKQKEIDEARDKVLHRLRELHANGNLSFEEEASS